VLVGVRRRARKSAGDRRLGHEEGPAGRFACGLEHDRRAHPGVDRLALAWPVKGRLAHRPNNTPDIRLTDGGAQPPPLSVPVPCGGALLLVVDAPLPPALPLLRVTGLTGVVRVTGVTGVTGVTVVTGVTGRTTLSERPPE
jgi:hypothetical protein